MRLAMRVRTPRSWPSVWGAEVSSLASSVTGTTRLRSGRSAPAKTSTTDSADPFPTRTLVRLGALASLNYILLGVSGGYASFMYGLGGAMGNVIVLALVHNMYTKNVDLFEDEG